MAAANLIADPLLLSVLSAAEQARAQSFSILQIIDDFHARDTPPGDTDLLHLSREQKTLNAHLAHLRGLNRQAVLRVRSTKHETAEARQEIDRLHLELQNLYYEQRHLRGEIAACAEYKHSYETLDMMPLEEFLSLHPEHASLSLHDMTIARIKNEHVQRQALEEQRQQLLAKKEAVAKNVAARKEQLIQLDGEIETWVNGAQGVRKMFEDQQTDAV